MNDAGIYSSLYWQIRHYSELVDNVLIAVKSSTQSSADTHYKELGNVLIELSTDSFNDLSKKQINLLLQIEGITADDLARIGNNLVSAYIDTNTIQTLEKIADHFEREQDTARKTDGRLW